MGNRRRKSWSASQWDKHGHWTDQRSGCGKSSAVLLAVLLSGGYAVHQLAGWIA